MWNSQNPRRRWSQRAIVSSHRLFVRNACSNTIRLNVFLRRHWPLNAFVWVSSALELYRRIQISGWKIKCSVWYRSTWNTCNVIASGSRASAMLTFHTYPLPENSTVPDITSLCGLIEKQITSSSEAFSSLSMPIAHRLYLVARVLSFIGQLSRQRGSTT